MKPEGGCYCGALRFAAEGEPTMKAQCHCRECQCSSGVAPFRHTKGEAGTFTRSDLERPVAREFCAACGTHSIARWPRLPFVAPKIGTLDDPAAYGAPRMAIFTVDRQPFHHVADGRPTFERLPARRRGWSFRPQAPLAGIASTQGMFDGFSRK